MTTIIVSTSVYSLLYHTSAYRAKCSVSSNVYQDNLLFVCEQETVACSKVPHDVHSDHEKDQLLVDLVTHKRWAEVPQDMTLSYT